jgi:DNA-binding NarL/FixJ family response regulator
VDRKTDIEGLVKAGVEKFILNHATIDDFLRTMRSVSEKEAVYSHQLTRSVLSRIVKQAVRKRQRKISRRKRQ